MTVFELDAARQRRREIDATFTPWHKDPARIARLYRWLDLAGQPPGDIARFIEDPGRYHADYILMCAAVGWSQ